MLSVCKPILDNEDLENSARDNFQIFAKSSEPELKRIAQLCSRLCNAAEAYVSYFDGDTSRFINASGSPLDTIKTSLSFCQIVNKQSPIGEISNFELNQQFNENPFVSSDGQKKNCLVFALLGSEAVIGTLTVVGFETTKQNPTTRDLLHELAEHILEKYEHFKTKSENATLTHQCNSQNQFFSRQKSALFQNWRLRTIGLHARGIAHEINNPLAIILGRLSIMQSWFEKENAEPAKMIKGLDQLKLAAERISKTVEGLKSFASSDLATQKADVSSRTLLNDAISFVSERFKMAQIELTCDPVPDFKINCRGSEISQVLVSVLSNAYDACFEASIKEVHVSFAETEKQFSCKISDSGPGILSEIKASMFEPFSSSKSPDQGMGAGLFVASSHLSAQGGSIQFDRIQDRTVCTIILPAEPVEQFETNTPMLPSVA
jgi:two-component system, NtrC family, sensor kinase